MKIWVDDMREAPFGYIRAFSVNQAKRIIQELEALYLASGKKEFYKIELIDVDYDAGDYANDGGDYIKLLDWLEEKARSYPIRIHSMNPVGAANMRMIIQMNNWTEAF